MKETIPELLLNQHLTYVEEEVCGQDRFFIDIMLVLMFFSVVYRYCSSILKFVHLFSARAELGEFIEYDLDNEDEDWLQDYNKERRILTNEK
jgi:hypothetical protein